MSKFDPILSQIDHNLAQARGEIYNFINNNKKKSAGIARKCLLAIRKACNTARKELQEMKTVLPVRRRTLSPETREKMAKAREARKAAKVTPQKVVVEKA